MEKLTKYELLASDKKIIPLVISPYFEMYPETYRQVAKYVNLNRAFIRIAATIAKYEV